MSTSITSGSTCAPAPRNASQLGAEQNHVLDRRVMQLLAQDLQALGRRDEHAHAAVGEDVGHLLGLQDRVDRHEHPARGGGAEDRHHGLDPLVEVDADPIAALEPERLQTAAEGGDLVPQLGVALAWNP